MLFRRIKSKKELCKIPVIINANFGHTDPKFTFPIGGIVSIRAFADKATIRFLQQ